MDFENPQHLMAAAQKIRSRYIKRLHTIPVSVSQSESLKETPIQGPIWVSKFVAPRPTEDSSHDQLLALVDEENDQHIPYDRPQSEPLHLEWTGLRGNVHRNTPEPLISEEQKFHSLEAETKSPLTILYFYGGIFSYVICITLVSRSETNEYQTERAINLPESSRKTRACHRIQGLDGPPASSTPEPLSSCLAGRVPDIPVPARTTARLSP